MGMFDDLIPNGGQQDAPAPPRDLIVPVPGAPKTAAPPAAAPSMFDDLIPKTAPAQGGYGVASAPATPPDTQMDDINSALDEQLGAFKLRGAEGTQSHAEDLAKSIGSGLVKGTEGLIAFPGAVLGLPDWAIRQAPKLIGKDTITDEEAAAQDAAHPWYVRATSPQNVVSGLQKGAEAINSGIDAVIPDYQPKTAEGRYAKTAAEFAPGAASGGGALIPRVVKYILAPGVVSEAAGEATQGTALEPWARAGAAILGSVGAGIVGGTSAAEKTIAKAIKDIPVADRQRAMIATEQLMTDAADRGIPLTRAEAFQQVTGGASRLGDVQRIVEGSGGLRPFFAERPAQVEAGGRAEFGNIAPTTAQPSMIGPAAGQAADQTMRGVNTAINATTRPLYDQAARARVGLPVSQALATDPLYARTLQEIRNDPSLNRSIAGLPDDSPAVLDLVQRRLREQADASRAPAQPSTSNLRALNFEDARTAPIAAAETATGSRAATVTQPAQVGSYEAARTLQSQLRERYLAPLEAGPVGKMAGRDTTTQKAIDALFPDNPLPGSEQEVWTAISALHARGQRGAWAARQLVRTYAEGIFNQATRDLQGGPNQFGGANFAALMQGNPQVAANFQAALQALPNGAAIAPGFQRFMDILQATGQRQRIGSQTSFNTEALNAMKNGSPVKLGLTVAAGAGIKWPQIVLDKFQGWRLGKNLDQLADLLVNPEAGERFRQIVEAPTGSGKAIAMAIRLGVLAGQGLRHRSASGQAQ